MYKIYINDTPLLLVKTKDIQKYADKYEEKLMARYNGKAKFLLQYVDLLEKSSRYDAVIVYYDKPKKLFHAFKNLFKRINAAGGVVFNDKNEILFIYRLQCWDLPKGKIEKKEKKKEAAIREVQEETGIKKVKITKKLARTFHTYRLKGGTRILKYTYWYQMKAFDFDLVPQAEEAIEKAAWLDKNAFLNSGKVTYGNIRDVLVNL